MISGSARTRAPARFIPDPVFRTAAACVTGIASLVASSGCSFNEHGVVFTRYLPIQQGMVRDLRAPGLHIEWSATHELISLGYFRSSSVIPGDSSEGTSFGVSLNSLGSPVVIVDTTYGAQLRLGGLAPGITLGFRSDLYSLVVEENEVRALDLNITQPSRTKVCAGEAECLD